MIKVLVCGGRDYQDWNKFEDELNLIWRADGDFTLISGGARGADKLTEEYAQKYKVPIEIFPAKWDIHGRSAGPIRNRRMLDQKPDLVVAFPGGKGTAHMIDIAQKAGVEVLIIE